MSLAVPWRRLPALDRGLTIGILPEDPKYPLHHPVRRALITAADKLAAAGYKVLQLTCDPDFNISVSNDLMFEYYGFDPDQTALKIIADGREPLIPSLVKMNILGSIDDSKRGDGRALAVMNRRRQGMMINFWMDVFVANELDVLLAPPSRCTAVEHDNWNWNPYTTSFNLVDFPAVMMPFLKVQREVDYEPFKLAPGQVGPPYNPEVLDGTPCTVQISLPPLNHEVTISPNQRVML